MAPGKTIGERTRSFKTFEILILFVLAVLLALCIAVSQVVVDDDRSSQGAGGGQGRVAPP